MQLFQANLDCARQEMLVAFLRGIIDVILQMILARCTSIFGHSHSQ